MTDHLSVSHRSFDPTVPDLSSTDASATHPIGQSNGISVEQVEGGASIISPQDKWSWINPFTWFFSSSPSNQSKIIDVSHQSDKQQPSEVTNSDTQLSQSEVRSSQATAAPITVVGNEPQAVEGSSLHASDFSNIESIDQLLLKDATELSRFFSNKTREEWAKKAQDLENYSKIGLAKIDSFEEHFINFVIVLLEYYHSSKTGIEVFQAKIETKFHGVEVKLDEASKSFLDTTFLDEGMNAIQRAFKNFNLLVEKKKADQLYNFNALNESVQILVSISTLQENIKAIDKNDIEDFSKVQNDIENRKKFLDKQQKWENARDGYNTTVEYSYGVSLDTQVTREIKKLAEAIEAKLNATQNKLKTADIKQPDFLYEFKKNKEAYDQEITRLKKAYLKEPQHQNPPSEKLSETIKRLSAVSEKQGTIISVDDSGLTTRKAEPFFWSGSLEKLRNAFWLNSLWFSSPYPEYTTNQKTFIKIKKKVDEQYGSLAAKHFEEHFAYRYRLGAPLTLTAVLQFLDHERFLNSQEGVITISIDQLKTDASNAYLSEKVLEKITIIASDEFEKSYGKITEEKDRVLLYDSFLTKFLKKPLNIKYREINPYIRKSGLVAFITARLNAMYRTLFPGDNKRATQEAVVTLKKFLMKEAKLNSQEVEDIISKELAKETSVDHQAQYVTFGNLCFIAADIDKLKATHDTWYNRNVRFWVRWLANIFAPVAVVKAMTASNNTVMALITGATVAGTAAMMEPEGRLFFSLSTLYTTKVESAPATGTSWFAAGTKVITAALTGGTSLLV